jgi:3-hydroxyacyl-[acyl-carrier-protein] dehydratase
MSDNPSRGEVGYDQVARLMPIGPSMLFIDRVLDWVEGERIQTRKCVTGAETYFRAHFSGGPAVVPGVFLVEGVAQSALLLDMLGGRPRDASTERMLAEVRAAFKAPVRPGDVVDFEVSVVSAHGKARSFQGTARVADRLVARVELLGVEVPA